MEFLHKEFDSIGELVEAIKQGPSRAFLICPARRPEFIGRYFNNHHEALDAAMMTWEEGLQTIEEMRSRLQSIELPQPVSRRRVRQWSEDRGEEFSYDRYKAGQAWWQSSHRERVMGPQFATVVLNAVAFFRMKPRDLIWAGAAVSLLVDILEENGYRVEVWSGTCSNPLDNRSTIAQTAVRVKEASEHLDLSSLVTSCSCWFYRTCLFWSYFLYGRPVHDGLGSPQKMQVDCLERQGDFTVISEHVWSESSAVKWVNTQLQRLQEQQSL